MALFNALEERNFIVQIQRILRDLNFLESQNGTVGIDGIYDEATRNAVRDFQNRYGISETGVVDSETWTILHTIWEIRAESNALARAVYVLPRFEGYEILPGTVDNVLYIIQHMLETISRDYEELEGIVLNGIYDTKTQNAIKEFQRKNMLNDTGIIDATTFNRLADAYEEINSRDQ
ncbi:MAG: peptidoglycan-binding protein [Clostridia bacterium]|nr:peptidoglycan-binding protein [Clostridia bacterium]